MTMMRKLAAGAATVALAACLATAAQAQETSGGINGTVTDAAGHTLANASVTITYTPTNTVRHVTTDGQGGFSLRGLEPGGPYTITAHDAGHTPKTVTDVQIGLGTAYQLSVALDAPLQEVVVRAARGAGVSRTLQTGPRSSFTATDLNNYRGYRTVEQAAAIAVRLATLGADGPTGTFQDENGPVPW